MKQENENPDLEVGGNLSEENVSDNQIENQEVNNNDDNLTDWEAKYNDLNDSYLRLNAEFDNYRKRTLKEKAELLKSGSERVLLDVVTVVDDFQRALENIGTAEDLDAVKEGVDLIYTKFLSFLSRHGVKEIATIGEVFDTDRHEALTTVPAPKDEDKDKIVDCVQKGYTLDDKVIRYPKVIVAK